MTAPLPTVPLPRAFVFQATTTSNGWAMQIRVGTGTDATRVAMPRGVHRVEVGWNGAGEVRANVGGVTRAAIPAGVTGTRRQTFFTVPVDATGVVLQIGGYSLTAADLDTPRCDVVIYSTLPAT